MPREKHKISPPKPYPTASLPSTTEHRDALLYGVNNGQVAQPNTFQEWTKNQEWIKNG